MNGKIKQLYQTQILRHAKEPYHEYQLQNASHYFEAYNPLCGDKFQLHLNIEAGVIKEASFQGYGCAISKASTSIMIKNIEKKELNEVKGILKLFKEVIDKQSLNEPETLTTDEELLAFSATRLYPERKKCASLSWDELEILINSL